MGNELSLDDLLHSLTHEGEQDSSGQFTLDINKATEKIRSFQLENPFQYCLRWLQGAVAGRARLFQWKSNPLSVDCHIDGMTLHSQRIARLPGLLVENQASPCERHFSAGLNAVIKTKARAVHITSGTIKGSWRPGGYTQSELKEPFQGIHIELERSPRDILSQLWHAANHHHVGSKAGSRTARDQEQTLLHNQGACAPLILDIQNFAPEWELTYQEPFSAWRLLTGFFEGLIAPPFRSEHWKPLKDGQPGFYPRPRNRPTPGGRKAIPPLTSIYLARPRHPHQHTLLYPIKDGVMLPHLEILKGRAGGVFLADVSDLHTDLTGLRLIQDDAFRALVQELGKILGETG